MNPTDTVTSSPTALYYTSDATRAIDRIVALADAKAKMAEDILARRAKARSDVADAEQQFVASLSDQDAAGLANAKRGAQDLGYAAAAIEDSGGAEGVRYRAIHVAATFATLATGFTERFEYFGQQMPNAMRKLADARHKATISGVHSVRIEFTDEVQSARLLSEAIITARDGATALRDWCIRWYPGSRDQGQTFDGLFGSLRAPLPISLS